MKPERLARTVIYQSQWVNLFVDKVQFPNGRIIEQHHLLDFEYPAVIVVIEDERQRLLLVRVCRYTTGRTDWELPAGGVEAGETVLDAAFCREELTRRASQVGRTLDQLAAWRPQPATRGRRPRGAAS